MNRVTTNSALASRANPARETVVPGFAEAGALLEIDLSALRANYCLLRERLGGVACAGVVKADAYGLGATKVAQALRQEECSTFFVAHVSEGIALRETLGEQPEIFILNGLPPGAEAACREAGLIPVLNSLPQLAAWREHAAANREILPAAVQIDSGMNRLGMSEPEVRALAGNPHALRGIDLRLVMSHLACADEPENPANEKQRRRFDALRALLPAAPASLANSSAIFLGAAYRCDLARPGAALYGINPTPLSDNPMRPVIKVSAKVVQTRDVAAGEGLGYGHAFIAPAAMRTATISIGYADGWHRRAASGGYFQGIRLPFVGRVSMDSIILDISALPRDALAAGDLVELIGPNQTVDDVAGHAGTIGYEIFTGLGTRFHRVYTDE